MDSSSNLVNCNSRNFIVHNNSQNSLIQHWYKFTLWPLPCRALSTICIPTAGGGRKLCKKSIMKGVKSILKTWFSPFLTLALRAMGGEKKNTCISKETIKVCPYLDNPRRYKFYTGYEPPTSIQEVVTPIFMSKINLYNWKHCGGEGVKG